jgi:ATP-dependent DNA helicase RecG
MDREALDDLLAELRAFGSDHQTVEAKRAQGGFPGTAWESLVAFANADGGVLMLGVDKDGGRFDVTGVDDPRAMADHVQSTCAELEPALRPRVSLIAHDDGKTVVVAEVPPVPREMRPCHRPSVGAHQSSFIRVGDADQQMSPEEVTELLASKGSHDHSRRPAPAGAALDEAAIAEFAERVRADTDREYRDTAELVRRWNMTGEEGPTLAGVLALGRDPEAYAPAARLAYRVEDPAPGARHRGGHFEGRIGEILDKALDRLTIDLDPRQVTRDGDVFDEPDVPREGLREIIGNALLHRSFTTEQEGKSVAIEVFRRVVVISSPGCLHVGAELPTLGLSNFSSVRNLSLVRACERLRTPKGARIVESQASGIAAADDAARDVDAMPPIFVDHPASFDAVLMRKALDIEQARGLLATTALADDPDSVRLVSVALGLRALADELPGSAAARTFLDARFAARALAHSHGWEDAAVVLSELEDEKILVRRRSRLSPFWSLPAAPEAEETDQPAATRPATPAGRRRRDRTDDLVVAIANSQTGAMRSSELGSALGLSSTSSVSRWISRALEKQLIEPTAGSEYAPNRAYRLTRSGTVLAERVQRQSQ